MANCIAAHVDRCEGRATRHHLIPQRLIKERFPKGAWVIAGLGALRRLDNTETIEFPFDFEVRAGARIAVCRRSLDALLQDARNIVLICFRHHQLVEAKRIYIGRGELPDGITDFASEYGFGYYLDRFYPVDVSAHCEGAA